ncbi:FKBP-type peptidyl-prolyl cis-trans isomerase [Aureispira]|nr:FKBP-type peptidyl-prolyl cis-trans isomerase [Aureispira sp.]
MSLIKLFLVFSIVFGVFTFNIAQDNGTSSANIIDNNTPDDRFAFSYGVLLGDNLTKTGLSMEMVSINKIFDGIKEVMNNSNTALSEADAQRFVNEKLSELQMDNPSAGEILDNKVIKSNLEDFCFNYGVLIGHNLNNFDLKMIDFSLKDFENGVTAMMLGNDSSLNTQIAQAEVSAKFQLMQKIKTDKQLNANDAFMHKNKTRANIISLASGIQYEVLKKGNGNSPTSESKVTTHYHGTLIDGTIFDSSVERNEPISFALTGVIKGWQETLPLMKEGGKIIAYIPPHMAYGNRTRNKIPANSVLIFEIELISVDK